VFVVELDLSHLEEAATKPVAYVASGNPLYAPRGIRISS